MASPMKNAICDISNILTFRLFADTRQFVYQSSVLSEQNFDSFSDSPSEQTCHDEHH